MFIIAERRKHMPTESIITVAGVVAAFGFFAIVLAYACLTSAPCPQRTKR
ncbi:hypothetical protein [Aminobacter sp. HY435]|nr:hypothetical protein [Aminobacter sp. HY435]